MALVTAGFLHRLHPLICQLLKEACKVSVKIEFERFCSVLMQLFFFVKVKTCNESRTLFHVNPFPFFSDVLSYPVFMIRSDYRQLPKLSGPSSRS